MRIIIEGVLRRRSPKPEPIRWTSLSQVHTAYCQDSIEGIVKIIDNARQSDEKFRGRLVTSFNEEKRCAQVYEISRSDKILIAEVEMDGSDGFPDCIRVTNYGLDEYEVELFRRVRDSRPNFSGWDFSFQVKQESNVT